MGIKVDHGNRSVGFLDGPEQWKRDGMVATESDHARESSTLERWTFSVCVGGRSTGENAVVAVFNLLNGIGVVIAVSSDSASSFSCL